MTPVCEISSGITTWRWLCSSHQSSRRALGWTVKPTGKLAQWPCDDCPPVERSATVDYAPTRAESFCPAPDWKADPPMAPWAKPAKAGPQRGMQQAPKGGERAA